MKRIMYVLAMLTIGCASTSFAQAIDGKWQGEMETPNGAMTMLFTFQVGVDTLSGTVESPMGAIPISNGKVKGEKFSFEVSFNDMTIHHECTVMADSISMVLPDMPDSKPLILKRAKPESK
jgi:hypothetical protein